MKPTWCIEFGISSILGKTNDTPSVSRTSFEEFNVSELERLAGGRLVGIYQGKGCAKQTDKSAEVSGRLMICVLNELKIHQTNPVVL